MFSTQIDARKEQLALAKTELKQAKKEAKTKGSSDPKLQAWVSVVVWRGTKEKLW